MTNVHGMFYICHVCKQRVELLDNPDYDKGMSVTLSEMYIIASHSASLGSISECFAARKHPRFHPRMPNDVPTLLLLA